jgi:hypothetical protein
MDRELLKISKTLGAERNARDILNDISSSGRSARDEALERLLTLSESDPSIQDVLRRHRASRTELLDVYKQLLFAGAGQWAGRHWVPASTLASAHALAFALSNANKLPWEHISVLLLEYFERDETGPVPGDLRGPASPADPLNAVWAPTSNAPSHQTNATLIAWVLVGGGIVTGALVTSLGRVLLISYIIAVVLNAYLLIQVAWNSRAWGKLPIAVLLGAPLAGILDGIKVAVVGIVVWVIARFAFGASL